MNRIPKWKAGNLPEYISILKENGLEDCISRGENVLYPSLNAAAFRQSGSLDIQKMVDEFEAYIGNSLTEMQRKHFLAFSQHYGLPTNLLDFTFSPLISLYFACAGEEEKPGYVYFIKKKRMIDLTGELSLIRPGLLGKLMIADSRTEELFREITGKLSMNPEFGREFLHFIYRFNRSTWGDEETGRALRSALIKVKQGEDPLNTLEDPLRLMDRRAKKYYRELEPSADISEFGSYSHMFIRAMADIFRAQNRNTLLELPFYFTYEPANITSRVSNQSSVLIYQLYGINSVRQAVRPDFAVEITNKRELLSDLNGLGINEKFIFNDFDHIASYIKSRHLKKAARQDEALDKLYKMTEKLK